MTARMSSAGDRWSPAALIGVVSLAEARRLVCERAVALGAEQIALDDALGRVLAVAAAAPGDVPPFDASAMDGYAVRAADTQAAPVLLRVVGCAQAGRPADVAVEPGTAVEIATGASIPAGADAVVRREDATVAGAEVRIATAVAAGHDVRHAGEDVGAGATVLDVGEPLGPTELGVLATLGIGHPTVVRRPRVALVGTGDELVGPGSPLAAGAIRDANGPSLAGAVRRANGHVASRRRVGDELDATVATLQAGLRDADVVVSTGGVSVGAHDHIRPALARLGVEIVFSGIAIKPGRPTTFGVHPDGKLVFALPGNPVSSLIAFQLLVAPALDLLGCAQTVRTVTAIAAADLRGGRGRTTVVRCRTQRRGDGEWHVTPAPGQDSHVLTSLLGVTALALLPPDRDGIQAGEPVAVELL